MSNTQQAPENLVALVDTPSESAENEKVALIFQGPQSYERPLDLATTPLKTAETEIVAFQLQGPRSRENLVIYDLGIITNQAGQHFLPLLQLLEALKIEISRQAQRITFQPEGSPQYTLDTNTRILERDGTFEDVILVEALSDISMKRDIFLPPETIARIFEIELSWLDSEYAYVAKTKRSLAIWKRPAGSSLLNVKTTEMKEKLPEVHPAAEPWLRPLSLDFMEVRARTKFLATDPNMSEELTVNSLEQTFWGSLAYGRYKLRISEPSFTWNNDGTDWSDNPVVMLNWGEWRYRGTSSEVVAGDSVFGLNGLIFPSVRMAGIRYNGIFGSDETAGLDDKSAFGVRNVFGNTQTYSGYAQVGSRVELLLNDRLVDTDEVVTSLPSKPGTGMYQFENITLGSGSLNNIRIVITDPDGVVTVIEKSAIGTSELLPKGRGIFLASLGTNRDNNELSTRGIYFGSKIYYGVNNKLTVGASVAYQKDFFEPVQIDYSISTEERQYPESSLHLGTNIIWQPFDKSTVSFDLSWIYGEDEDLNQTLQDPAATIDWLFYPSSSFDIHTRGFWYGKNFFDGSNRDLRDRTGYVINPNWHPSDLWNLQFAAGQVWDNLDGDNTDTRSVNFQNATISSSIIPRTTLNVEVDRVDPNWNEETKNLYSIKIGTTLFSDIRVSGSYSTGDNLYFDQNNNFLNGLRLPGISLYGSRSTSLIMQKYLPWGDTLSLSYWESGSRERVSMTHKTRFDFKVLFDMRTELGFDIDKDTYFFEHRTEIPLNQSNSSRFGFHARSEEEEWKVEFYLSINELFSFLGGRPKHISNRTSMKPENGLAFGRVFLDKNANAILDKGEQGLEGIEVLLNNSRKIKTDKEGRFFFTAPSNTRDVQIHLNPKTVPAIYGITHGLQKAFFKQGEVTEINLGLTPLNSIFGNVFADGAEDEPKPIIGIRVFVTSLEGDEIIAESITAGDGSYYLQDIRPGQYLLRMDPDTIPAEFTFPFLQKRIEMKSSDDFQEIEIPNFIASGAKNKLSGL